MVDRAQLIAGNHDDFAVQSRDQIPHGKPLSQGTSTPPIPSMSRHWQRPAKRLICRNTVRQADRTMMFAGGDERRERLRKEERG